MLVQEVGRSLIQQFYFLLMHSKAVVLLDRYSNQKGESLDFATGLGVDVLNGKATSDSLLLESHSQIATQEDILSVKEFIYRQTDILRGKGGLVTNSNSGSTAGAGMPGMVDVTAAAAAASAAAGKTFTTTELPSIDICTVAPAVEGLVSRVTNPLEIAVSCLESGKGLNTLWCQRALPAAKEVYLNELRSCYPTSKHELLLEKALRAFWSMVKGPAVQLFMKNLEDECTSIWSSGRQLCDAISLTGKPCMHQRHSVETDGLLSKDGVKPHSSGFVFLQTCACGRSRRLRSDPFDFETANITFDCFTDCDKLLPSLKLPQSGFSATQKFLLKWKIFLEKPKDQHGSLASVEQQGSVIRLSSTEPMKESIAGGDIKKSDTSRMNKEELQSERHQFYCCPASDRGAEQAYHTAKYQGSQQSEDISVVQDTVTGNGPGVNGFTDGIPILQIGSNVVPGGSFKSGSNLGKSGSHAKAHRNSNRMNNSAIHKVKNLDKTKDISVDGSVYLDGTVQYSRTGKEDAQSYIGMLTLYESVKDLEESLHTVSLDDGAFSLLNRNLPIYMNCLHCRISKNKKDPPTTKFAGTISQLQRIFLVRTLKIQFSCLVQDSLN
ncbi:hypothetical protein Acr_00g0044320 [Actinidia rufa]|uniref:Nonsense-mediated mRNA decay factor SMG8 n=1 Tax=Actinidia rufa TaxID=165716 RepID=A0A7J0DK48_9ERIC|nr:hypothetical protein Acr_00g0044320 [Actinidia rufa]